MPVLLISSGVVNTSAEMLLENLNSLVPELFNVTVLLNVFPPQSSADPPVLVKTDTPLKVEANKVIRGAT